MPPTANPQSSPVHVVTTTTRFEGVARRIRSAIPVACWNRCLKEDDRTPSLSTFWMDDRLDAIEAACCVEGAITKGAMLDDSRESANGWARWMGLRDGRGGGPSGGRTVGSPLTMGGATTGAATMSTMGAATTGGAAAGAGVGNRLGSSGGPVPGKAAAQETR